MVSALTIMTDAELKRDCKRAFRAVMREMNRSVQFDSPEELEVLRSNFRVAQKRSIVGLLGGGAAATVGWRYAVGTRMSPVATVWGAITGAAIGMFSIRQKLFLDLLSIPEDRSPFARRARQILEREMPLSPIYSEISRRRHELYPRADDSYEEAVIWTEPPPSSVDRFTTLEERRAKTDERVSPDPFGWQTGEVAEENKAKPTKQDAQPTTWAELRRRASRGG